MLRAELAHKKNLGPFGHEVTAPFELIPHGRHHQFDSRIATVFPCLICPRSLIEVLVWFILIITYPR
jgi:hypothetical protein